MPAPIARVCSSLVLLFAALLLAFSPAPAHADTYEVFALNSDAYQFYALSSTGVAVLSLAADPACSDSTCYYSYLDGVSEGYSTVAPTFTPDDGSACSPTLPSGWSADAARCNNNRVAWTGLDNLSPPTEVYTGPASNPFATTITGVFPGQDGDGSIYINSAGDIVFDDTFYDQWYEAVDLTTLPAPEPSTLLLLSSGLAALGFAFRRRNHLAV